MIVYVDSSVLARAYLVDEDGHEQAKALLADVAIATVTGTWTKIEVSGALVRAARTGRGDEKGLLGLLDADLDGPVTVLAAPQEQVELHHATRRSGASPALLGLPFTGLVAASAPTARSSAPTR